MNSDRIPALIVSREPMEWHSTLIFFVESDVQHRLTFRSHPFGLWSVEHMGVNLGNQHASSALLQLSIDTCPFADAFQQTLDFYNLVADVKGYFHNLNAIHRV